MLSTLLDLIGVAAFAVSGAMVAIRRQADLFGVLFLALITALGGGIVRDMLLGLHPPRMFTDYEYIALAAACALAVFLAARLGKEKYRAKEARVDAVDNVFDAIGLAAFTVSGANVAIGRYGLENPVLIVAMGMTTGFGGGMLRDVLTNAMPMVLCRHVYAVASLAGAVLYVALLRQGVNELLCDGAGMLTIFALRMLATRYKWNLPHA